MKEPPRKFVDTGPPVVILDGPEWLLSILRRRSRSALSGIEAAAKLLRRRRDDYEGIPGGAG